MNILKRLSVVSIQRYQINTCIKVLVFSKNLTHRATKLVFNSKAMLALFTVVVLMAIIVLSTSVGSTLLGELIIVLMRLIVVFEEPLLISILLGGLEW